MWPNVTPRSVAGAAQAPRRMTHPRPTSWVTPPSTPLAIFRRTPPSMRGTATPAGPCDSPATGPSPGTTAPVAAAAPCACLGITRSPSCVLSRCLSVVSFSCVTPKLPSDGRFSVAASTMPWQRATTRLFLPAVMALRAKRTPAASVRSPVFSAKDSTPPPTSQAESPSLINASAAPARENCVEVDPQPAGSLAPGGH